MLQVSASCPVTSHATPTSLRRASTFTLEEEDSGTKPASKKKSSITKPASMSKKSSTFVEEGTLVTRLSATKSGSIIGETSMSIDLSLARKSSSVRSAKGGVPSIPSGLTKLAIPDGDSCKGSLRVSTSKLIAEVDETEIESALASLKSTLSKKKSSNIHKSHESLKAGLSKRTKSVKPVAFADCSDQEEEMDATSVTDTGAGSASGGSSTADIMEVVISFDTTGSMYGVLEEVRAKVQDLIQRLQGDIPGKLQTE